MRSGFSRGFTRPRRGIGYSFTYYRVHLFLKFFPHLYPPLLILALILAALDTLKPADIAVVRTMRSPPAGVRLVMAAVCVMLGIPPLRVENPITGKKENDYWTPSKRLLGDMRFLETLRQYDKDNIPPHIMNVYCPFVIPSSSIITILIICYLFHLVYRK